MNELVYLADLFEWGITQFKTTNWESSETAFGFHDNTQNHVTANDVCLWIWMDDGKFPEFLAPGHMLPAGLGVVLDIFITQN